MSRERDPLAPGPHWRVDLRLTAELPEDNVIGTRFLIHVAFTAVAFGALLCAGWFGYSDWRQRREIRDWEQRIRDSAAEAREVSDMQKRFAMEAAKIDQAWTLMRPPLRVYEFLTDLGRTRPEALVIDIIEWNESGIVVRGSVRENPDRSLLILGPYVTLLNSDEKLGSLFTAKLTNIKPPADEQPFGFEITFRFKAVKS